MRALVAVLLIWLSTAGLATTQGKVEEELNIREATYRYQFEHNGSMQQQRAGVFCLEIYTGMDYTDPSDAFIKRFAGYRPPVKKGSDCDASASGGVFDREAGQRGLIFRTNAIKWFSETEVAVFGGYYEDGFSATMGKYHLRKIDGIWNVVEEEMISVS